MGDERRCLDCCEKDCKDKCFKECCCDNNGFSGIWIILLIIIIYCLFCNDNKGGLFGGLF